MSLPAVSIIVPARNEEANIEAAVESLARQSVPAEIIVVDDGSTDATGTLLKEMAARTPDLHILAAGSLPPGWAGKNHAAWLGARQARGDWLLFTDADVRHAPEAVATGLSLAEEHRAGLVSYSPTQEMRTWWEYCVIPWVYLLLALLYRYSRVNDASWPDAAANGQWLLISRRAYEAVGGHEAVRAELVEDVALARRVKQAGFGLHFRSGRDLARTRMYRTFGEMWEGWSKNLAELVLGAGWKGLGLLTLDALLTVAVGLAFLPGWTVRALLLLLSAHLAYGVALVAIGFSPRAFWGLVPGAALVGALMLSSWMRRRRGGPVRWKGRRYPARGE